MTLEASSVAHVADIRDQNSRDWIRCYCKYVLEKLPLLVISIGVALTICWSATLVWLLFGLITTAWGLWEPSDPAAYAVDTFPPTQVYDESDP